MILTYEIKGKEKGIIDMGKAHVLSHAEIPQRLQCRHRVLRLEICLCNIKCLLNEIALGEVSLFRCTGRERRQPQHCGASSSKPQCTHKRE